MPTDLQRITRRLHSAACVGYYALTDSENNLLVNVQSGYLNKMAKTHVP